MKNVVICIYRWLFCKVPCIFRMRQMWWKSAVSNSLTRISTLSRSRKIILCLLILLALFYYIVPRLFSFSRRRIVIVAAGGSKCLADKVAGFQTSIDTFDALLTHVPPIDSQNSFPPYVGNGQLAASFNSQNGLFIRLNRALSLPVKFYPVVGTVIEDVKKEEVNILNVREGIARRIQLFKTLDGCVSVESEMYAYRSRPSVLIQEIDIENPTESDVYVDLDHVKASGWVGAAHASDSATNHLGKSVSYTITSGIVSIENSQLVVAAIIATVSLETEKLLVSAGTKMTQHIVTVCHYTKPGELATVEAELSQLQVKVKQDITDVLTVEPTILRQQHTAVWARLWQSGFSISYSLASGSLNGDKINATLYYVLSNVHAPQAQPGLTPAQAVELTRKLHTPDKCYKDHTTLHSSTLWLDPVDEDSVARIVTTWIITLEKQGCAGMIQAGAEGVLQAMILSIGSLHFGADHLEMGLHPKDTHRDFNFHRLNYGNTTHLNISVLVGDDNKATIHVALDRNDKPFYACDAGCLDPPVQLSKTWSQFPVKLTEPLTSILYITYDREHMEEYKHAIHVKEIVEAPAHEHHVIALHRHGHHFGGLPAIFWVSIAFLVIVFHLFLFKLIYNEYCVSQDKFARNRYNS